MRERPSHYSLHGRFSGFASWPTAWNDCAYCLVYHYALRAPESRVTVLPDSVNRSGFSRSLEKAREIRQSPVRPLDRVPRRPASSQESRASTETRRQETSQTRVSIEILDTTTVNLCSASRFLLPFSRLDIQLTVTKPLIRYSSCRCDLPLLPPSGLLVPPFDLLSGRGLLLEAMPPR